MTHQEVLDFGIVGRYIAGELTLEEARAFDAHVFECDECFAAARAADHLRGGVHESATAGELPLAARASIAATTARARMPAWAACVALAAIAAVAIGIRLRPPPAEPNIPVIILPAGDATAARHLRIPRSAESFVVWIEGAAIPAATSDLVLRNASGVEVARVAGLQQDEHGAFTASFRTSTVTDGRYTLQHQQAGRVTGGFSLVISREAR